MTLLLHQLKKKFLNMKILIIPIILVLMIGTAIYLIHTSDESQRKPRYITLLITLIGTSLGVYGAVYFNNQQKIKDEKRQIEALIKQTTKDIDQIRGHCKRFKKNISEKVPNPGEWLDHNPIREPLMLEKLLSNDLFAKYCIIASTYLFNELSNIKPALNRINNSETPQEWRMDAVGIYSLELEHIKDLLDNSRGLPDGSKGEKDFEELDKKWREKEKK
ncbi:MAG TPA: hypothetical protein VI727_05275 [Candidatus Brocadiaceae bacterium]|nr:hypothetical protein [Candidatus Brocadiaceae bacterium]